MLPLPPFELFSPSSLDEVIALLERHGPEAKLVAGGTDLLPNMKHGLVEPRRLVSLAGVAALRGLSRQGDALRIGAMTTLEQVAREPLVREHARALAEAAQAVGGPHHRRMGTLGGNLCLDTRCRYFNQTHFWRSALGYCLKKDGTQCHVVKGGQRCVAAASNDCAAAVIALGATLELVGPAGSRRLPAGAFYTADGLANTVLAEGELVVACELPLAPARTSAYEKLRLRGAIDFPLLSVAARLDAPGGLVDELSLVVSALAAKPRSVQGARAASGLARAELPVQAIAAAARRECVPLDNVDGDAAWRRDMVPVLVGRALARL